LKKVQKVILQNTWTTKEVNLLFGKVTFSPRCEDKKSLLKNKKIETRIPKL
jgi:hypothetical protein